MSSITNYQWEVIKVICRFILNQTNMSYFESGQMAEDRRYLEEAIKD